MDYFTANFVGIILLVLAIGLFIAEAHTGSGILLAAGIIVLVIGFLVFFRISIASMNPGLLALIILIVVGFIVFAVWRVVQIHRRQATTGWEEMVGKSAIVKETLNPEGTVFLEGERWLAHSEAGRIDVGQEVIITRVDGLKLYVTSKGG